MVGYEDDPLPTPKKISELYNVPSAIALVQAVFPKSTADVFQRLTGAPIRTVTRWIKGESRIPPRLLEKLREQRDHKREFDANLERLLEAYADKGMLRAVMRQSLLQQVNGDFLQTDEEI